MPIRLTINNEQFVLRDPERISRLHTEIENAVQSGGRLVIVGDHPNSPEVLITPTTAIRIDIVEAPDENIDGTENTMFIDFDQY